MRGLKAAGAFALWIIAIVGGLTQLLLYWGVLNIWMGKVTATLLTIFFPFGALALPLVLPVGDIAWTGLDAILVMGTTFVCSKLAHRLRKSI